MMSLPKSCKCQTPRKWLNFFGIYICWNCKGTVPEIKLSKEEFEKYLRNHRDHLTDEEFRIKIENHQ